ncbi:NADH dehydrogenase [ubiquinone] 1 alpha subcomplex subunit 13 [Aphelenchoides besseyi]|nr:NADH dehydrogenase [ubiquinone] 1 alpha subcomplex subunit 13 [Aphelenchoides besseyi]KAI6202312.1 NADH dehydrogenase [ubiquinone] 1 alpha subcomplex subunit 13 [Aphelenchoides besseyi]
MSSQKPRQDLPPEGGYRAFNWDRTYPKRLFRPQFTIPVVVGMAVYGAYQAWGFKRQRMSNVFEDTDVMCALQPFLTAERDRRWLKMLRKHRDLEEEVMKDVPGWKVGTWYGEPVYFTLGDKWFDPEAEEIFAHTATRPYYRELMWRQHSEYAGPKWYDDYLPEFIKKRIL